jgi:Mrp family chromosome partitioning ATPase
VDLDFRWASLHRFFDLGMQPGIADVVLGSAHLDDVIVPVELKPPASGRIACGIPLRRAVPLGTIPPRAADAAFTLGLEQVLGRLAARADLMLMDSPPLLRVGDALALTNYVPNLRETQLRCGTLGEAAAELVTGAEVEGDYGYLSYRYDRASRSLG